MDGQSSPGSSITMANISCPICLENVAKENEIWACYRCEVMAHMDCMPRINNSISTINGCPGCRYTEQEAVQEALKPVIPPLGVWCSICWKWIKWSEKVIRCPAPDQMCLGHAHPRCFRGVCGACNLSTRVALRERRDRNVELFRTKM